MIVSDIYFPNFGTEYFNMEIEKVRNSGLSEEQIAAQIEDMEAFMVMYENPIFKFFLTYIEILPVGILISLISAAVLRKK